MLTIFPVLLRRPASTTALQPLDVRKFGDFSFCARTGSAAGQNFLKGEHDSPHNQWILI
jgi:hypothetical protein